MSKKQLELDEQLLSASWKGDHQNIVSLLDAGANIDFVDETDSTALHYAAENGCNRSVHLLIANGANVNAHKYENAGDTPIINAARKGHFKVIKLLLSAGADPYIEGWMRRDALHHAERLEGSEKEKIKKLILKICPMPKDKKYNRL